MDENNVVTIVENFIMNRFQQICDIFERSRNLAPAERDAFLHRHCGDNQTLLEDVQRLLRNHDDSGFLDEPGAKLRSGFGIFTESQQPNNMRKYHIVRKLGQGGMGVVYLAEQENPRRHVAVKVICPGLVGRDVLKRFDLEVAMLGRLQHPGIAQIHEAATYEDESGTRPYFAMEFVDGSPLLDYARDHQLDLGDRLETFARICDAVEHAHQRGVIHRDLKPHNVLVDKSGQPKILDFGVARVTASDLQVSTMHTDVGQLIGTLAYMSPEQVLGRAAEIDTRSDVYALGIVLYELISDRLPYDLGGQTIVTAARVIAEQEPSSLTTISRRYRGDLDTIAQKALEKEPDRRYQSAAALAADIRHYLNNEPIVARPVSTLYQLRKFARRNRGLVFGVAAAFVALLAGVIVATTFAIGQTRALAESERQRSIASAVNDFLTKDLIVQADPRSEPDRQITLQTAIDRAAEKIEGRFDGAPIVEANLRRTVGTAYRHLNRLDDADQQFTRALELYKRELGECDEQTLLCRADLASVLNWRGDYAGAEHALRELLQVERKVLGDDHTQTIGSISNLGVALVYQGKLAEAEPVLEEGLERRIRVQGERNEDTATTLNNLAAIYLRTGRNAEAESAFSRALDILREVSGDQHPQTLNTFANLGVLYAQMGRYDEAVKALEKVLEIRRKVMGEDHRDTLKSASNLASAYGTQGQKEKSEQLLKATLTAQQRVLGEDHGDTLDTRIFLAKAAQKRKDYATAEAEYAEVVARSTASHPGHWRAGLAALMQGQCLVELEQLDRAEEVLLQGYQIMAPALGKQHPYVRQTASLLAELYTRLNKPDETAQWRMLSADGDASSE